MPASFAVAALRGAGVLIVGFTVVFIATDDGPGVRLGGHGDGHEFPAVILHDQEVSGRLLFPVRAGPVDPAGLDDLRHDRPRLGDQGEEEGRQEEEEEQRDSKPAHHAAIIDA
jgi:hypothetical protein